jgi:tetratricopeptide (TPR) repeat protein
MAMDTSRLTDKAREAVQRRNYEYAIDLYQQALALNPDDSDSRRELRAVATRFVQENGISAGSAWLKALGPGIKAVFLGMSRTGSERTLIECEKFLKYAPGNIGMLTRLGRAATTLGYFRTAMQVFTDVRNLDPNNVANLHLLADAYERLEMDDEALKTCDHIRRVNPADHLAAERAKNLSAKKASTTFKKGAEQGSTSIVRNTAVHEQFEIEKHDIRSVEQRDRAIAFQKEKLAQDKTGDPRHLATFHGGMGDLWLKIEPDFVKAEECYRKAQELQPTDKTYEFKIHDLKIMELRGRVKELQAAVKAAPGDAAAKAELQKVAAEYRRFRTASYEDRVKWRPMDLKLAFTLGGIHFEQSSLDEAIRQFQRTVGDPARRRESLLYLGICFSRKNQFDLAVKQFEQGIAEIPVMNDMKKDLLYNLGDTREKMGAVAEALSAFTQLYEADISFKDVQKRVDALKKKG